MTRSSNLNSEIEIEKAWRKKLARYVCTVRRSSLGKIKTSILLNSTLTPVRRMVWVPCSRPAYRNHSFSYCTILQLWLNKSSGFKTVFRDNQRKHYYECGSSNLDGQCKWIQFRMFYVTFSFFINTYVHQCIEKFFVSHDCEEYEYMMSNIWSLLCTVKCRVQSEKKKKKYAQFHL